jgi:anti-sigma factor RsiW
MSTSLHKLLVHHHDVSKDTALEALNLFMDGELPGSHQPSLFSHLAECPACRRELEGVIKFRRISRGENLMAPPMLDEAVFKRLNKHKAIMSHIDRAEDRRPLWNLRTPISLRATILTALMVFITGLLMPKSPEQNLVQQGFVTGTDELIEFADLDLSPGSTHVYVFYPGLTIEASYDAYDDELIDAGSP